MIRINKVLFVIFIIILLVAIFFIVKTPITDQNLRNRKPDYIPVEIKNKSLEINIK